MLPLTDEQQRLAEKHAGLIWWFIHKYHLGFEDPEAQNDWYGEIAEAYLIAVHKYHAEKGSFSTFACACMQRHMKRCLTYRNQMKRSRMTRISLSQPVSSEYARTLEEFLPDQTVSVEDTVINRIYASEMLSQILAGLTDKHKEALLAKAHYEKDWKQAAKSLNLKPGTYKQRIFYARNRIRKVFLEDRTLQRIQEL